MKTQSIQSVRVIESVKRLNNSVNGNPRYRVTFTDGSSALTKSDSSVAYDIQNLSHSRERGRDLLVTWTRAGRIEMLKPVPERAPMVDPDNEDDREWGFGVGV
jgi:hypothetical protein